MAQLVLGPMLRHVSAEAVTIWLETDEPCRVEIRGVRTETFQVNGRHYAIVAVGGLPSGGRGVEYEVLLDGARRWPEAPAHEPELAPEPDTLAWPPPRIRALPQSGPIDLVWGSCRVSRPHRAPYTLSPDDDDLGTGVDALYALALRMRAQDPDEWPHMLLLLGDQVYADEIPPEIAAYIRNRRDVDTPPGLEVADFDEYARLYREAWADPPLRWLLSTLPTAMIFDDHDVHDDWNTSAAWRDKMRTEPWWPERITGALATYWIYQHLGNLSPAELDADPLLQRVKAAPDAGELLREFALAADGEGGGGLWSFSRDLVGSRLVVLDGREGRILEEGRRDMLDEPEWRWLTERMTGDFDHLLLANTLPVLLPGNLHYIEAWSEAVCAGAWGRRAARAAERLRQGTDLEHWAAFQRSFHRILGLVREAGAGRLGGRPPTSIVFLGGDVHQSYLHEVAFPAAAGVRSAVYQAVCSPFRNPLPRRERRSLRAGRRSAALGWVVRRLAHTVGVADPEATWSLTQAPAFANQLATLRLDGRRASLRMERTRPGEAPSLETILDRRLA